MAPEPCYSFLKAKRLAYVRFPGNLQGVYRSKKAPDHCDQGLLTERNQRVISVTY